jgi:hypothetical protein
VSVGAEVHEQMTGSVGARIALGYPHLQEHLQVRVGPAGAAVDLALIVAARGVSRVGALTADGDIGWLVFL